jgi:UDP-glucuronate 4-epimerase
MTILLTGGAGFIGSHLAERLLGLGHKLILLDDLNDFYSPVMKQCNLAEIKTRGDYEFAEIDICDLADLTRLFKKHRPDVVVHLAARAGVRPSLEQPLLYEHVNVQGTLHLLELARQFTVQRFVFASSSSIYGTTSQTPFTEDEANPNPISPYGVTMLAGEKLCYCYARLYAIPTVCLRFFTVYGPRQRPDLAIHKFARLIHEGREIPMFGDGSSLRDYTFIDDIVDGITAALSLQTEFEVFNLGNSQPVSLSKMIRLLGDRLGRPVQIAVQEFQPGDMPFTHANLSKARGMLGYEPKVPFEEGLSRFVSWFKTVKT